MPQSASRAAGLARGAAQEPRGERVTTGRATPATLKFGSYRSATPSTSTAARPK